MEVEQSGSTVELLRFETQAAFERVWDSFVGLPRNVGPVTVTIPELAAEQAPWIGSLAWIGGTFAGNLRLIAEPELATAVASQVLGTPEPAEPEIDDVFRELANMVGGNLKSVLPGICGLAIPGSFRVRSSTDLLDDFTCVVALWYWIGDRRLLVTFNSLERLAG